MKKLLLILFCLPLLFTTCKKEEDNTPTNNTGNNVTELEGTWIGLEVQHPTSVSLGDWTFIFSGNEMNVTAPLPNPAEWYLGTYSINTQVNPKQVDLAITDCSLSSYIGTTAKGIYKIENDTTLTYSGCGPGNPGRPSSFLDTSVIARMMILTKQ